MAQEGGIKGVGGPRFGMGVWLGFDRHTTQNVIFDSDNGGLCYACTLTSLPDPQKIDVDRIAAISFTSWSMHEKKEEHSVLAPKDAPEQAVAAENVTGVCGVYI